MSFLCKSIYRLPEPVVDTIKVLAKSLKTLFGEVNLLYQNSIKI